MKNSFFAKKRNSFVSALVAGMVATAGLAGTTLSAIAAESTSPSIEQQIFEVCQYQCFVSGDPISAEEEQALMTTINETIHNYALEINCSYDEAGELVLSEMMTESGLTSMPEDMVVPCSGGKGSGALDGITYKVVTLPISEIGNIFFADNEWAWNHVGMYTSTNTIIEAVPDLGVQDVSIYSSEGKQHRTLDNLNDSCILKVDGASASVRKGAVEWAQQYIGRPYSGNFIANKNSDETTFNCSELVWKAYKNGKYTNIIGLKVVINIDLDSNGGLAVYPNNIKNSSKVSVVCKW